MTLVVTAAGCDSKAKDRAQAAVTAAPAPAPKPSVPLGGACSSNQDCGSGLGCAEDKTCQKFGTIDCRGREQACKGEGRCTGSDKGGCIAASDAECKAAKVCQDEGRCRVQDGKCAATSKDDCKEFCPSDGRCSVVDGKCAAASPEDCRKSEACKQQKKCVMKLGVCMKM